MPSPLQIPPLVRRARALAAKRAFLDSCTDEVGALLRTLAATIGQGTIAEIGTGCGVGTAWLADGLGRGVRLVTIERDAARASGAAALFAEVAAVTVLTGDRHALAAHAPFEMLFADGGKSKEDDLHPLLRRGAIVVLDDFTDPADWDDDRRRDGDALRDRWLADTRFASVLVGIGPDKRDRRKRAQALVATRL